MTTRTRRAGKRGGAELPLDAVLGHGDLATSLLFIFPLFLIYGVGVIFAPAMNGVDFVSRNLYAALDHSTRNYLLFHAGMAALFGGLLIWLRKKKAFDRHRFWPMILESLIFALTLGSLIIFVMRNLLGFDGTLATGGLGDVGTGAILSIGAGVHEELVFRLGMLAGGAALLRLLGLSHGLAIGVAFVVSAALFSAAHHLGAMGDPWAISVFTYRLLAGLLFGALFYFRSLATAVYTHALYDIYVILILGNR